MACISRALIVGGGIAGLSSAIALSRIGVACNVVELKDAPLGASLGISGRAAEALDALGVYEECFRTSRPFSSGSKVLYQWDAAGKLLSPGPQRVEWPGAKTALGVYRPDFLQVLGDEANRLGALIRTGVTVRTVEEGPNESSVTFTDGGVKSYDLIIGADGLNSATRARIFPRAAKPAYSGQISIRWMAPGPAIEGEGWYHGSVGRIGFYYVPQGLIYVASVISTPDPRVLGKDEVHALFTSLLNSYTAEPIAELRRRLTPDAALLCNSYYWTLVPEPWHRGRTLLIGDAAHATTSHMGMGGGMALEDSVVLAECLATAATLDDALAAFMARRFERVRTVVESSVGAARLELANAPQPEKAALLTTALKAISQPY
jgi:2-polyprenyl-6-methoxyphenol hydroxylase-like FAD-dependent oxidoreductase